MADATTVSVLIRARDEASAAFKNIESNAGKMAAGIAKHRAAIGKAALGIGAAIVGIGVLSVKSSLDQQKGIDSLDVALKNVGTSYDSSKKKIEELVAAQQNKTNFGDEEQRKALQELIQVSGSYDDAMAAMIPTMDLAAAKDMDLAGAATLVARAISGEATALGRYGIKLDNTAGPQEVLNTLLAKFGGQAEANADPLTQLGNRMGDLAQVIGDILLPIIEDVLPKVEALARKWIEWAEAHPELSKWIVIVTSGLGLLLIPLGTLLLMLPMLAAGFALVSAAIWPITAVVIAVTVAIAATILVWKNWDKMSTNLKLSIIAISVALMAFLGPLALIPAAIIVIIAVIKNWDTIMMKINIATAKLEIIIQELWLSLQKLWLGWRKLNGASDENIKKMEANIKKTQDTIKASKEYIKVTEEAAVKVKAAADETADAVADGSDSMVRSNEASGESFGEMADDSVKAGEVIKTEQEKQIERDAALQIRLAASRKTALEAFRADLLARAMASTDAINKRETEQAASLATMMYEFTREAKAWDEMNINKEITMRTFHLAMKGSFEDTAKILVDWGGDLNNAVDVSNFFKEQTGENFFTVAQAIKDNMRFATEAVKANSEAQVNAVIDGNQRMLQDTKLTSDEIKKMQDDMRQKTSDYYDEFYGRTGAADTTATEKASAGLAATVKDLGSSDDQWEKSSSRFAMGGAYDTVKDFLNRGSRVQTAEEVARVAKSVADQAVKGSMRERYLREVVKENLDLAFDDGKPTGAMGELGDRPSPSSVSYQRAMGGPIPSSGLALVGERGPELVSLPGGSFVHRSGTGPGGQTNNFIFNGAVYGVEDLKEVVVEAVRDHAISGGFSGVFQEA